MPGTSKKISDLNAIATMHDTDLVEVSNDNQDSTYTSVKATIGDVADHIANEVEFTNDLDTTDKTLVGAINEVAGDIPTVNDATLTIQKNSTTIDTFSANASSNVTVDISVPTTVAELSDASDYATTASLAAVATSGDYDDLLNKPTIPAAQVNSDWNSGSGVSQILNKPTLAAVATSGAYSDLSGTPTLATVATSGLYSDLSGTPTLATVATSGSYNDLTNKPAINDATITFTQGGTTKGSITLNQSADATIALDAGGGGGGHTILDDEGTSLTQRTELQFKGAYSTDNSTDQVTEVNVVREMTKAEFDLLSSDEKVGIINVTDEEDTADTNYSETTLWSGSATVSTSGQQITLSDNISHYDEIVFVLDADYWGMSAFVVSQLTVGEVYISTIYAPEYYGVYWDYDSDTAITIRALSSSKQLTYKKVVGIKYGNGTQTFHNYSTAEKIAGEWIDGSTLYEKTLYFNNKKATQSNSTSELVHGIADIGTVKFVESAYIDFDGGTNWATAMNTISVGSNNYNFAWVVGSDAIYLKSGTNGLEFSANADRSYLFTIQYTKA